MFQIRRNRFVHEKTKQLGQLQKAAADRSQSVLSCAQELGMIVRSDKKGVLNDQVAETFDFLWTHFRADELESILTKDLGVPKEVFLPMAPMLARVHPSLTFRIYSHMCDLIKREKPNKRYALTQYVTCFYEQLPRDVAHNLLRDAFKSDSGVRTVTWAMVYPIAKSNMRLIPIIQEAIGSVQPQSVPELRCVVFTLYVMTKLAPNDNPRYLRKLAYLIESPLCDNEILTDMYWALCSMGKRMPNIQTLDFLKQKILIHPKSSRALKSAVRKSKGVAIFKPSSVRMGECVAQSQLNRYGWCPRKLRISPDEVCVLFMGGSETKKDRMANKYVRHIWQLLDAVKLVQKVHIYSLIYDFGQESGRSSDGPAFHRLEAKAGLMYSRGHRVDIGVQMKAEYMTAEAKRPHLVQELFDNVFLSRISDVNGHRLSTDEAIRRVRNITVVGHCFGGFVFAKTEELMRQKMTELGYPKSEQKTILEQLMCVFFAPDCPLNNTLTTQVSFCSSQDTALFHYNHFHDELGRLLKEESVSLSFFPKARGNFFLVPRLWTDKDETSEHAFVGFCNPNGLTDAGVFQIRASRSLIVESLLSALKGEKLKDIRTLMCVEHPSMQKLFDKSVLNGQDLYSKILKRLVMTQKTRVRQG